MSGNRADGSRDRTVLAMRPLTSRTTRTTGMLRRSLRRGATMLEFALVLPIFMFMLLFAIDMGHLVLMSGAMQDATFSAARTGAQVGGGGINARGTGSVVCANNQPCRSGSTYTSLTDTAAQIPGFGDLGHLKGMKVNTGAVCLEGANDHVQVTATYETRLLTPGLGVMLNMMSNGGSDDRWDTWTLSSTAIARCEVIRS